MHESDRRLSINDYWVAPSSASYRQMDTLDAAQLKTTLKKTGRGYEVEVVNRSEAIAIGVKLNAVSRENGEIILPAYFSDGYFNLLPHEKRTIELELPEGHSDDFEIVTTVFNN